MPERGRRYWIKVNTNIHKEIIKHKGNTEIKVRVKEGSSKNKEKFKKK
jgi:hypothetical protein